MITKIRDLFKDEDGSVSYLWFKDNWHKHPWISKLLCAIGRHDFEYSETLYDDQDDARGAKLVCFYCEQVRNSVSCQSNKINNP
jgi:hypothetical protein